MDFAGGEEAEGSDSCDVQGLLTTSKGGTEDPPAVGPWGLLRAARPRDGFRWQR